MPVRRVSDRELRQLFNDGSYYERMLAGEFRSRIVKEVSIRRGDQRIRRSRSQTVEYLDNSGTVIARVHQYRMPDGSLDASGRPDPKLLRDKDVVYILQDREEWDIPEW